jgi:hypothetical protein
MTTDEIRQKVHRVARDGNWHTAWDFNMDPRALRRFTEETHELIGGQHGYKLTVQATEMERREAAIALRSRANKILARAEALEKTL